jgi:C-terminal processing protease CtpA/Prc
MDEQRSTDAHQALLKVREQYGGDLRYRIEREGLENKPNKMTYTRYAIKIGDVVNYSRLLKADEKDAALVEIKQLFPGADITAQEVTQ